MAVLKNRTQNNFTMISNTILRDRQLCMKDRGVLCTIISFPDGWNFSVSGLAALVIDGRDSIGGSVSRLEQAGYLKRTTRHGAGGKFETEIEVFDHPQKSGPPSSDNRDGITVTAEPLRLDRDGSTATDNPAQYNTNNKKQKYNTDYLKSIHQSGEEAEIDGQTEINAYRKVIASNIGLDSLIELAEQRGDPSEKEYVKEIYELICNMVCYPREKVVIKDTEYPWQVVKSQFLKLNFDTICDVLNRIIDKDLHIKNMKNYLISTLYNASLVSRIEQDAKITDDYLKFMRGKPFSLEGR